MDAILVSGRFTFFSLLVLSHILQQYNFSGYAYWIRYFAEIYSGTQTKHLAKPLI